MELTEKLTDNTESLSYFLVEWIDLTWYLSQAEGYGIDPPSDTSRIGIVDHYIATGRERGLSPHPMFSDQFYRSRIKLNAGIDPFEHFIRLGRHQGIPS